MRKRFLSIALSLMLCLAFVGCGESDNSNTPDDTGTSVEEETETYYTVIFKQNGQEDKIYENVLQGSSFTNIPETVAKTGYIVSWDESGLSMLENITGNVIVEAVERAKTYTITFNPTVGTLVETTLTVTYGEEYSLPRPASNQYLFKAWAYGGKSLPVSGTWNIDFQGESLELTAQWENYSSDY